MTLNHEISEKVAPKFRDLGTEEALASVRILHGNLMKIQGCVAALQKDRLGASRMDDIRSAVVQASGLIANAGIKIIPRDASSTVLSSSSSHGPYLGEVECERYLNYIISQLQPIG